MQEWMFVPTWMNLTNTKCYISILYQKTKSLLRTEQDACTHALTMSIELRKNRFKSHLLMLCSNYNYAVLSRQ